MSTAHESVPNGKPEPEVYFSAERTYLSWVRTGVSLMAFGFVLARFSLLLHQLRSMGSNPLPPDASDLSRYFGIALVMVGVLMLVAATVSHIRTVRRLNTGEPFAGHPTWVGILVALLLAAVGTLMSIYLFRN